MAIEVGNDQEGGGGSDFYGGGGGDHLREEGTYHFLVVHVTDMPLDKNGGQIVNAVMKVQLSVCGGPHKDKLFEETFFTPKPEHEKRRAIQRRQFMRLAYACNLVGNEQIIAGKLAFEPADMEAHQLIAKVHFGTNADGSKSQYLEFNFADIWHVDDPDAPKDCVLDKDILATLPDACRRKPEYFQALKEALKPAAGAGASGSAASGGNGAKSNGANGATKPATTKPATSLSDL